jgi:hypothetical protein
LSAIRLLFENRTYLARIIIVLPAGKLLPVELRPLPHSRCGVQKVTE